MKHFLLILPAAVFFTSCGNEQESRVISTPIVVEEEPEPTPEKPIKEVPVVEPEKEVEVVVEPEDKPKSVMQEALAGHTLVLKDGAISKAEVSGSPSFYIVYITAEWSQACKEKIGGVKEFYAEKIATNPDVELVMVSIDADSSWVHQWAKDEKFAWPMIMADEYEEIKPLAKIGDRFASIFALVDKDGERHRAHSLEECMDVVSELK